MKILFLIPYPLDEAPSQRFRFEQYFVNLIDKGIHPTVQPFFSSQQWKKIHHSGNGLLPGIILLVCWIKRWKGVIQSIQYDLVFIHREASPFGPPIIEWVLVKLLRKKLIYDFDDAIWITDKTDESRFERLIRWRSKVALICRWSYKVSCGNDYLANYARKFNYNVIINPTTIDLKKVDCASKKSDPLRDEIVIGWTGSHSTLKYLKQLEGVLSTIENQFPQVRFRVIADRQPNLKFQRLEFIKWNPESEIEDLRAITIGIMPLPDDEWTKGKCGFKALQYMSLSIPTIASPVGVNSKIIQHGVNGMLASSTEDWLNCIAELMHDFQKRSILGAAGRKTIEKHYSVVSNEANFLSLFS